jgi:uncharacterized membrane protein YjgN (DUF898 family)
MTNQQIPTAPTSGNQPVIGLRAQFQFDGGAGTYLGTAIGSFLLTVLTLGIGLPWAICMRYRWRAKHTIIGGYRVAFTGTGGRLFGNWIKWWFFTLITLGIYSFWLVPKLTKWITEHQQFELAGRS